MDRAEDMVLVSAIIITHNRKELLKRAISSVMAQTYSNIEIIVVDDASDINLFDEIKQEYNDKVKYLYISSEESRGGNHARNVGALNSSGEYLAFLDDDDDWLPTKIEKQIDIALTYPDTKVVGCGVIKDYCGKYQKGQNCKVLPQGDLSKYVLYSIPYRTSTLFVSKAFFCEIGMFDENLKYWQEYEFEMRAFQKTTVRSAEENLVNYRVDYTDNPRLTNKLIDWSENVDYINTKHSEILLNAGEEIQMKRKLLEAKDGALRAENSGDSAKKRYYLKIISEHEKSIKWTLKYLLNIFCLKDLLIKKFLF